MLDHRRSGRIVALTLLFACLSACTHADDSSGSPAVHTRHAWTQPDSLRIASGFVPRTLNPVLSTQSVEGALDRLFSSLLVTADAAGNLVPDLAADVPTADNGGISPDGLTITYKLRDGVKWHDGQPFTSKDVKFTFDTIMNRDNDIISRHGYDVVKSVDTPDDDTVVFHLKHRFAPFVATVFGESDEPYEIIPEHILGKEKTINEVPFNSLPIGTGPFKVTRWVRGSEIDFERFDDYFRGKPKLKTIVVKLVPDENTEITLVRSHDVDWMFEASVNAYESLRQIPPDELTIQRTPFNGFYSIMMNTAKGPMRDIRVRKAILYAIDKNQLLRGLTFGSADVATQDLPSFMWAYDKTLAATPYNLTAARSWLASAGYGPTHRLSLEMYYEQSSQLNKNAAVQIQAALAPIGIDVHLHPQLNTLIYASYGAGGTLARGNYDLALYLWIAGVDPDDSSQFTCDSRPPNGNNDTLLCDKAMDAAQEMALDDYAQGARKVAYAHIQHVLEKSIPHDFLWWPRNVQPINPDLHGFDPNPVCETWDAWRWSI